MHTGDLEWDVTCATKWTPARLRKAILNNNSQASVPENDEDLYSTQLVWNEKNLALMQDKRDAAYERSKKLNHVPA